MSFLVPIFRTVLVPNFCAHSCHTQLLNTCPSMKSNASINVNIVMVRGGTPASTSSPTRGLSRCTCPPTHGATQIADARHNAHRAGGTHCPRLCRPARMQHAFSAAACRAFAAWLHKSGERRCARFVAKCMLQVLRNIRCPSMREFPQVATYACDS